MFSRPGIGIDDLAWIHRDQYVHYVLLAHGLSDADDWPRLREDLLRALTAAFGLDAGVAHDDQRNPRQRHVLELLEEVRREHDPATDWPAFFDTLWSRRDVIRPDLA
jgi:hypothetical protein